QQQHGGELASNPTWREENARNKRRNSAPSPRRYQHQEERHKQQEQHHTTPAHSSTTSTVPEEPCSRKENPAAPQGRGVATTAPPTVAGAPCPPAPVGGGSGGPLRFPMATFSLALKVDDDGGSRFTLVSQKTGRRWRAVDSTRECQFGEVLRAVELTNGVVEAQEYFAIKELSLDKLREMQGKTHEDPLREVAALQYLPRHPNVLTCTEALYDEDSIYVVTPFYSGGEVFDALAGRGRFDESEARPLFRQMLEGLLHLKTHGVCHRDVSLENLVLAKGGVVKLIDFGLALRIPQTADGRAVPLPPQGPCGKQYYMAPEVLASASSSGFDGFAVDVWACGIVLFVMLTGVPLFELALPSRDQRCYIVSVEERLADMLKEWQVSPLSTEVTDLIQSCLLLASERRPSLETLLSNPWVNA
ncbi:unnamed protein product, partial [Hapterophycus canaliculatus]